MSDLVRHVTEADFGEVIAGGTTLVDFWAPWCGPCKTIAPMLDELAGEYGEKLQIAKINVDECPTLASQFGVMSIPTLILFKNGKLASQRVGGSTKAALKAFIDGIL